MNGLKKIWYCDKCEYLFTSDADKSRAECPICQHSITKHVPSRILENESALVPIKEIELGKHHYFFKKKIGAGGFGVIYMVEDENHKYYAMKLPKSFIELSLALNQKSSVDSHTLRGLVKQNDAIDREVTVITKHYFQSMMPLIDYGHFTFADEKVDFFIQELGYISLAEFLEWTRENRFLKKWETRYWIAYEIAKAVAEAHARNIFLRDLSTENVMFSISETDGIAIRLIDFGGAKTDSLSSMLVFRNLYIPPSLINEKGKKRDVFNLGVLFYEILSNHPHWVNLIGDLNDFQDDEFHRILTNFDQEIITPKLSAIPNSPDRKAVIKALRKATKIGNNGKYQGYPDAEAFLNDLPPVETVPAATGKIIDIDLTLDLKPGDETQEVLLIDKYVHRNKIQYKNIGLIISKNYNIKVLGANQAIYNKDNSTIAIDLPTEKFKNLAKLNGKLDLKLKIEVVS